MSKCASVPKHSKFPCSGAERFLACPASIQACRDLPDIESPYAKEGTDAHFCFEQFIKVGPHKRLAMEELLRHKYPRQMVFHASWASQKVFDRTPPGASVFSERKVSLDWIHQDFGGTLDVSIVQTFVGLEIIDLKYGQGVVVEPERNLQLIAYALAASHEYDDNFYTIDLVVVQPRIEHSKGPIRSWRLPMDEIEKYAEKFKRGIDACEKKNPKFQSGKHCRFCKAKDTCKEYDNYTPYSAQEDFADLII